MSRLILCAFALFALSACSCHNYGYCPYIFPVADR